MNGIGRRISISTFGIGVVLEGGIIKDKNLDGFARYLRVAKYNKGFQYYIGWWRDGWQCGYGRRIHKSKFVSDVD